MEIVLPAYVRTVIGTLEKNGYEAYAVGGCVRDHLMGKAPHDYDVTTSAMPNEVETCFEGFRIIETGLKHGTVTVLSDGEPVEITTYRTDGRYEDNRHPTSVSFTKSLSDDLSRRDFTVNAMAYSEKDGLVDLFGGREDLENKLIRCVGDADVRFNEDGLRIIRALRFASTLGFSLEEETKKSVLKNKELLVNISKERIYSELTKLLCGKNAADVLKEYPEVIAVIIPEIIPMIGHPQVTKYHCYDVYEHTVEAIRNSVPDKDVRYALFFHDIGKPHALTTDPDGTMHFHGHGDISAEISEKVMRNLKTDRETQVRVKKLVKYHSLVLTENEKQIRRLLRDLTYDEARKLVEVMIGDALAHAPEYRGRAAELERIKALIDKIESDNKCVKVTDLAVNGNDMLALGISGKQIGQVLSLLLDRVVEDGVTNEKDTLLELSKKIITDMGYAE